MTYEPLNHAPDLAMQTIEEREPSDACPRCGSRCHYQGFCEPCTIQLEADREEGAA